MNWLKKWFKKQEPELSNEAKIYESMKDSRCGFAIVQEDDEYIFTYHMEEGSEDHLGELLFVLLNSHIAMEVLQGLNSLNVNRPQEGTDFEKVLTKYKDMSIFAMQQELIAQQSEEDEDDDNPLINPMMIFGGEE